MQLGNLPFKLAPFQEEALQAFNADSSLSTLLINAPTGSGKSLAAFLAAASLGTEQSSAHFLWITPLKALARDLKKTLDNYSSLLSLNWSLGIRSGDSPQAEKSKQEKKLPTGLIITPESLSLLLTYPKMQQQFSQLKLVVIDEWHELMSSKRGVQTELCLARLRKLSPLQKTIGLSATIGNLETALKVLHGSSENQRKLIRSQAKKEPTVSVLTPKEGTRFSWAGHLGISLAPSLIPHLHGKTSLIFTNTRFQAERWYQELLDLAPNLKLALHHGSVDKAHREDIENQIKSGELEAVVCTSSLDLGVDFPPVDQVVQIGSPRSVARALQRAGRSGHQPGASSSFLLLPTNQWELADFVTLSSLMKKEIIEPRIPLTLSYDVLVQHLCILALGGGFTFAEALHEVRTTHAYSKISEQDFSWVLDFIVSGGNALKAYESFRRVTLENSRYVITSNKIARLHRLSIGTIASFEAVSVKYARGGYLGQVEERFIASLKPGDTFIFAGKAVELLQLRDMKALVRSTKKPSKTMQIPTWEGGKMPFSVLVGAELLKTVENLGSSVLEKSELKTLERAVRLQLSWSRLPSSKELLIESVTFPDEHHLFFYPFMGRQVHEGLALLLAKRLSDTAKMTIGYSLNDYGLDLFSGDPFDISKLDFRKLFSPVSFLEELSEAMNLGELVKRHFREIARIAGLIFQGYPGKSKSTKQLTLSSSLLFDVFKKYDPGNLLVSQAHREVLELKLESSALENCLRNLQAMPVNIIDLKRLSPLSFGLWAERLQSKVSSESFKTRIEKAVKALEKQAEKKSTSEEQRKRA